MPAFCLILHKMAVSRRWLGAGSSGLLVRIKYGLQSNFLRLTLKWVQEIDIEERKVSGVARCDPQTVNPGSGGNHSILKKMFRLSFHEARPLAKAGRIYWKQIARRLDLIKPQLNLASFRRILLASPLNASLKLAESNDGDTDLFFAKPLQPRHDRAVWPRLAKFGNDIGVEQVTNHLNSTGLRRLSRPRLGNKS